MACMNGLTPLVASAPSLTARSRSFQATAATPSSSALVASTRKLIPSLPSPSSPKHSSTVTAYGLGHAIEGTSRIRASAGTKFNPFLGQRLAVVSAPPGHKSRALDFRRLRAVNEPDSLASDPSAPPSEPNESLLSALESHEATIRALQASLADAQAASAAAQREKDVALAAVSAAEIKSDLLAADMVSTTEQAVAEVEEAKVKFQQEVERLQREKEEVEKQLALAKLEGIDLALKVEEMASRAVQEQADALAEDAKLKIAAANAEAADLAAQMEEKIRLAADEAAAAVIEEAKATIEDAIAAADIAKEQARSAEAALQERLDVLDRLGEAEVALMRSDEQRSSLQMKLEQAENEKKTLRMEIKAAIARAEAAESRIVSTQAAVSEIQALAERTSKEREQATERALEAMKLASAGRERAAALAYKADTDSLRASALAAQKADRVKDQAVARRFAALQRSLAAAEESTRKWRERCLAVEELFALVKERSQEAAKERGLQAGKVPALASSSSSSAAAAAAPLQEDASEQLLGRGRMDVMLANQSEKWRILADGPRRERPEWLQRKLNTVTPLPSLPIAVPVMGASMEGVEALLPLELPKPGDVWSIAQHKVVDDVFTQEAEAKEAEAKEIEEKRRELERTMQKKTPKRIKSPEDIEESLESGTGSGREIVMQAFNWESSKRDWYLELAPKAADMAACGITSVWLPPPTESVSPQGYMPVDLYNLNSSYGSKEQLQFCIDELHNQDLLVLGDVVLNHRCASKQSKEGVWNIFGGKLAWGPDAIVRDDPNFHGRGNPSSGDIFHAAPNIDHAQDFVRRDICEWLKWLRSEIGYDGWRLDFARGFWGGHVKEYIEASTPAFCIGEYWDSLSYEGGTVAYNQNGHRQRIINWINATGGTSSAFDVTTKGILHSALHNEYWRLIDPQGKPPGVMGWWPSRAVTFLENHDTGSTQGHWPFPRDKLMQGYAYILSHPGTPVIFYDHFYDFGIHDQIAELIAARKHAGVHCRSPVKIFHANAQGYVAQVGDNLVLKLGFFDWNPSRQNDLMGKWEKFVDKGNDYQLWERV